MSPLVSILYICDYCRKIRQFDLSMDNLKKEGSLYKVIDAHKEHEVMLYLNSQYEVERVISDLPPPSTEPVIKSLAIVERSTVEPFEGANRIFNTTKDVNRLPLQFQLQKLILLNMNGKKTLADILQGLSQDWPDLDPEYLSSVVHHCVVRGWIQEVKEESKKGAEE